MKTGNVINLQYERADKDLVEEFRDMPVANIDDALNKMVAVSQEIRPVNKTKLLGTAFTVKVPYGDNLFVNKAMDLAKPGDVIVIDSMGTKDRAIFGELMSNYCRTRGITGFITDGPIRDIDALSEYEDLAVYASGNTPNGPYKNGPGEIGTTISFGGQVVRPGDIIVGDQDGIVIVKKEEARELAEKVKEINEKEKDIIKTMEEENKFERPWVDEKLKELDTKILD